jgi:DEAD/DEAH box helicase domain-containing protein
LPDINDIIQAIARQRGRSDAGPLIMLRQLDASPGERISHLPVDGELAQAWVALTSEPFRPHQAQALTALRRGEPVALAAAAADVDLSGHLLLYATLLVEPHATALLLAPDMLLAREARDRLEQLNEALPQTLRLTATLLAPERRPDQYARVVVAAPDTLHGRLLRHHDRAWSLFWPRLRLALLPDLQRYTGVAGAHLADLLLRLQRITAAHGGGQLLNILATMIACDDPAPALATFLGQTWRTIPADDGPHDSTTLAVWRGPAGRLRESAELATAIRKQGYHVHIACSAAESALLTPAIGDIAGISWGPIAPPAHVLIAAGYPGSLSGVRRMLRSGHQAVIVVLGDLPHEQALARQTATLLSGPASSWPAPAPNAYAAAQHVLCAASELPLTEAEATAWGAQDIVARLVQQGQLVDLPDPEVAWKPTPAAGEPYAEFSLLAASGSAITARGEQGQTLGALDPTGFERWTFLNAALPPGAGGFRVVKRDEDAGSVTLRLESNGRRTYPLRRCEVVVREERETRALKAERRIGWGRVVVDEQIYGYREATAGAAPADMALQPPLAARWAAPACWFEVAIGDGGPGGSTTQVLGQFVGWSLAAALPLRALASFTDIVPCYDHKARRLYLVDAQPGGNGLSAWIYAHAEELLPLAYDVALACRNDTLLEPLSRADMDWLLALLGRVAQADERRTANDERRPAPPIPAATKNNVDERPGADKGRAPGSAAAHATPATSPTNDRQPPAEVPPPQRASDRRHNAQPARPAPPAGDRKREQRPTPADERLYGRPQVSGGERDKPAANREPDADRLYRKPAASDGRRDTPPQAPRPATPTEPRQRELPLGERRSAPPPPAQQPNRAPPPRPDRTQERAPQPDSAAPRRAGAPAPEEAPPDPAALIARLRRQREQREGPPTQQRPQPDQAGEVEQRFAAGDRIFCLPYGDGTVRESRIEGGRELLTVDFASHGDLTIDPAVNFVRKQEDAPEAQDDLL